MASGASVRGRQVVLFGVALEKARRQQRNIFPPGTQRRQIDGDDVEPVVQIFAKLAFAHGLPQIDVGGRQDAHVHLDLVHPAQVHEAPVLQHAQDLGLRIHSHGADLVQEQGAEVGHLKKALLGGNSGSERTLDVAKEGRFEQIAGHGARIDGHKGFVPARGIGMERFRDQFLAGSAFALDQDGGAGGSYLRHQVEDAQHRLAFADDIFKVVALLECPLELDILFFRAMPGHRGADIGQKLFVIPGLLDEVLGARRSSRRPRCRRCRRQ